MRERQRLLERMDEGLSVDTSWLEALEAKMAEAGTVMARARLAALSALQGEINDRPASAFPKADLALSGYLEGLLIEDEGAAQTRFAARLKDTRRKDGAAGRALTGPHRTELEARHREKDQVAADCSTGEQKALLLGLALAHGAALARERGAAPVMIFDEACAHLDVDRREGLASAIAAMGCQAWLTGVEKSLFTAFGDGVQYVSVEAGRAVREG